MSRHALSLIGSGLVVTGLIAGAVGMLVALPEYGATVRSWIGAPLLGRNERVGRLRWLVTPRERNAFLRRMTITADLNDLAVMDGGRTILVVGDNGTLFESVDAGATWRSLAANVEWREVTPPDGQVTPTPPSRPNLRSVAVSLDGSRAIVVGDRGTVLTSDDHGATWTERASGSSVSLDSVAFDSSTEHAIAVGERGTVLISANYGLNWTEVDPDSSGSLRSVAFDPTTGRAIAVASGGTVLTSDDNGLNWIRRFSASSAFPASVAFDPTTPRVIAVGGRSVLTSDDNGDTWTERSSGSSKWLFSVAPNPSTGQVIAVGSNGIVLTSDNNGLTWTEHASGSSEQLTSVAFDASSGRAVAVGQRGIVLTSDDNGATWTERSSGSSGRLSSAAFDATTGRTIAVGWQGTVITSDDNGLTWTERASDSSERLNSVAFDASLGRAVAVGHEGNVFISNDNGVSWTKHASGSSALASVAQYASTGRIVAAGGVHTVFITDDNGTNWTARRTGSLKQIVSLAFDATIGRTIAVGGAGTVLTSDDQGKSWTERDSNSSANLLSVAFDGSRRRAIAVGEAGTVLTSDDQGESWTKRDSNSSANLLSVAFDGSRRRAIAVGEAGTVLTSDDQGESWIKRDSGTSVLLFSVVFDASTGRAIAMHDIGTMLTSADNGVTWSMELLPGRISPAPLAFLGLVLMLAGLLLRYHSPILTLLPLLYRRFVHGEKSDSPDRGQTSPKGIVNSLSSDRPLGRGDVDQLDFDRYVKGLSGLLRNPGTGFPITVAITGEWGSGKSSFMSLLEVDLNREHYFSAWFNAWHDQNEENVLSSLLLAIRKQAVPSIFSRYFFRAFRLRVNLLCSRGIIYVLVPLLLLTAIGYAAWHAFEGPKSWAKTVRPAIQASIGTYEPFYVTDAAIENVCDELEKHGPESSPPAYDCPEHLGKLKSLGAEKILWFNSANLRRAIEALSLPHPEYTIEVEHVLLEHKASVAAPSFPSLFGWFWPDVIGRFWHWLAALFAAVVFIANGMSAFGFTLRRSALAVLSSGAGIVDRAGRHEKLRIDFRNVSKSLDRSVVFIDDLDRCQPGKVVETLEAVNFLVTAGKCAVVMSMDYEQVERCVGLARKELADSEFNAAGREIAETERRAAYARRYLRKIFNVEMPIVDASSHVKNLVEKPESGPSDRSGGSRLGNGLRWIWRFRIWVIWVALVGVGHFVAPHLYDALVPAQQDEVVNRIRTVGGKPVSPRTPGEAEGADVRRDPSQFEPARSPDDVEPATKERTPEGLLERDPTPTPVPQEMASEWTLIAIVGLVFGLFVGLRLVLPRMRARGSPIYVYFANLLQQLLKQPQRQHDSGVFREALAIWLDLVVHDDSTPRTVKMFLNRVRFLAAMLRAQEPDGFNREREVNLVALAALHHVGIDLSSYFSPEHLDTVQHQGASLDTNSESDAGGEEGVRARDARIRVAVEKHARAFGRMADPKDQERSLWPPDRWEIEQFERFSDGIHLSGPSAPASSGSPAPPPGRAKPSPH